MSARSFDTLGSAKKVLLTVPSDRESKGRVKEPGDVVDESSVVGEKRSHLSEGDHHAVHRHSHDDVAETVAGNRREDMSAKQTRGDERGAEKVTTYRHPTGPPVASADPDPTKRPVPCDAKE
jgi:hypothetical protein